MQDNDQSRRECGVQLRRLGGLPNFPTDTVAVKELVTTMLENCRDWEHLEATTDALRNCLTFAPRPIDIIDQAAMIHAVSQEFPYCAICNTSGIAPSQRVVEIRGERYEFSGPCSCAKGRHVRALADKAKADASAKQEKAAQKRVDKYAAPVRHFDGKMAAGGEG